MDVVKFNISRPIEGMAQMDEAPQLIIRRGRGGGVAVFLSIIGMICHLISISGLTQLGEGLDLLRQICLVLTIAISAFGIILCILSREFIAAIVSTLFLSSVPYSAWIFSATSHRAFVPLSGGDFYAGALFSIFFIAWRSGNHQTLLRSIYIVTIVYGFIYLLIYFGMSYGLVKPPEGTTAIILEDVATNRTNRLVLAHSFATFGIFVSVASLMRRYDFIDLLGFAILSSCLFFSQSRFISAIVLAVFVAYVFVRMSRVIQRIAFGTFLIGFIASVYVAVTPGLNPFKEDRYNLSTWARSREISIAQRLIPDHYFTGYGTPNGVDAYKPITDVNFFYPSDIGLVGVLFAYGIFGLFIYILQVCGACFAPQKLRFSVEPKFIVGLSLAGAVLSIYSLLAPVFTASGWGSLFLALLFAKIRPLTAAPMALPS
jgi:hypothetical protein